MNETLNYIFKSMNYTEQFISRELRRQTKFNKSVGKCALLMSVYVALNEIRAEKQKQEIRNLKTELEEIKNARGEQGKCDD